MIEALSSLRASCPCSNQCHSRMRRETLSLRPGRLYPPGMAEQREEQAEGVREGRGSNVLPARKHLPMAVKQRAVVLFAQFHRLAEVTSIIREEFGLDVAASTLCHYDPTRANASTGTKLRALFAEARKRHLEDMSSVGIAHQVHRLRTLDRIAQRAETKGDFGTVMSALKQAAEEVGGVMSNERNVNVRHLHLSPEDARAELAMRLGAIIEAQAVLPPPDNEPK